MNLKNILTILPALSLAGCKYDNQFENVPASQQHAVLTAQPAAYIFDRGPLISHIDNRPPTFWRTKEYFLITPGAHELCVIADKEPYGFKPVKFTATSDHRYEVRYEANRTSAALYDVTSNPAVFVVRAAREQSDR